MLLMTPVCATLQENHIRLLGIIQRVTRYIQHQYDISKALPEDYLHSNPPLKTAEQLFIDNLHKKYNAVIPELKKLEHILGLSDILRQEVEKTSIPHQASAPPKRQNSKRRKPSKMKKIINHVNYLFDLYWELEVPEDHIPLPEQQFKPFYSAILECEHDPN